MADGSNAQWPVISLDHVAPFRAPSAAHGERVAQLEGAIPTWLRGQLTRTAPARFATDHWQADHWFDALGMLFAFSIGDESVGLRWQDLDCAYAREIRDNRRVRASFGTPSKRTFLQRATSPVPMLTDNCNVNVVPRGDHLVALTETPHQLNVDPETLRVTGAHVWSDSLGDLGGIAHPSLDSQRQCWVDVAVVLAGRPKLVVFEHDLAGHKRSVVGSWAPPNVPYTHAFGLSASSVVLIAHPLTLRPLKMLFSDRPLIENFVWDASAPTLLGVMSRATGQTRTVEAPTGFVFHVIDCFDDGEDVVIDVLRYPDADVVYALRTERLAHESMSLRPMAERWRVRPHKRTVDVTVLAQEGLEFPQIHRKFSGPARDLFWGTSITLARESSHSRVHRVSQRDGERFFARPGVVYGEPIFVAKPSANAASVREGDGALLCVGSKLDAQASVLTVLDAQSLEVLADAWVDVSLPLGFHGGFSRARGLNGA